MKGKGLVIAVYTSVGLIAPDSPKSIARKLKSLQYEWNEKKIVKRSTRSVVAHKAPIQNRYAINSTSDCERWLVLTKSIASMSQISSCPLGLGSQWTRGQDWKVKKLQEAKAISILSLRFLFDYIFVQSYLGHTLSNRWCIPLRLFDIEIGQNRFYSIRKIFQIQLK